MFDEATKVEANSKVADNQSFQREIEEAFAPCTVGRVSLGSRASIDTRSVESGAADAGFETVSNGYLSAASGPTDPRVGGGPMVLSASGRFSVNFNHTGRKISSLAVARISIW